MGTGPLLQCPHWLRADPALLTLLFSPLVPLSYQVLCGSLYSSPLFRFSCLLSAGVLHTLLHLQVYSWCTCGERCTPHPPTPLPSCTPRIDAFELWYLTLECSLDCKEIKPVNPKGNQSWTFIGKTDAEAETPVLWLLDGKNWLTGKDPEAGKDWRKEEKGMTEDEMVGWHHQLNGHEFEQTPGFGDGQGSLVWCDPLVANSWTWLRDWTELN